MKVLIATDTYFPYINGGTYFILHLAEGLKKRGHEPFVITASQHFADEVREEHGIMTYRMRSIRLPAYNNFRVSPPIVSRNAIERAIKEINPDVIHLQHHFLIGKGVFQVAKKLGIPMIGTNHSLPENIIFYFHVPEFLERQLEKIGWKQFRDIYDELDEVTAPTKTAADLTQVHLKKKQVLPVSNGINLDRYQPGYDIDELRTKFGIPEKNVILYTGRVDQEKHIHIIVQALREVRKSIDAHLVITGDGGDRKSLEKLIEQLGLQQNVTFTGFLTDEEFPAIYCTGQVFAIASIAELQSIVTMEALASGLPVVAVNEKALPELVHEGENGFLFELDDVDGCARGITRILENPELQKKMSKKSLEIISRHKLEETIKIYEDLYLKAIKNHVPSLAGAAEEIEHSV